MEEMPLSKIWLKMKRIYFATSFIHRSEYQDLYTKLKKFLHENREIELYSFVFEYKGDIQDRTMMSADVEEMNNCDLIVAEVSYKSIGVGVEMGYFKAQNKKIIYLHKKDTEIENITNGIADYVIEYSKSEDIVSWFDSNLDKVIA